ncbi:hypothetical protein EZS27_042012, partial [termite gut metagenome]
MNVKESSPRTELKERIIITALTAFKKNGIKSITMGDVAALPKMSKRTLYELFEDKETLLKECVIYHQYLSKKMIEGIVAGSTNVLERSFKTSLPNQKWVTDVTQINIKDERIYLSPILDLFNGEIIGYSISKSPNMQMISEMLDKAFEKVKDTKGIIFHSDQGWQYQHYGYRKSLEEHGILQSMS